MDRKQFFRAAGATGIGVAVSSLAPRCWAAGGQAAPDAPTAADQCGERIEFAEGWVRRFMAILEETVDEPTRARLLEANGRACYRAGLERSGRAVTPTTFAAWAEKVKARGPSPALSFDESGFTIRFQGEGTGEPAGKCLCRLIEGNPSGVSPKYCDCSLGYVKESFGRLFGQPVKVTLLESVLRGAQWCRFRVDVG